MKYLPVRRRHAKKSQNEAARTKKMELAPHPMDVLPATALLAYRLPAFWSLTNRHIERRHGC
jgi:hypothetical protein